MYTILQELLQYQSTRTHKYRVTHVHKYKCFSRFYIHSFFFHDQSQMGHALAQDKTESRLFVCPQSHFYIHSNVLIDDCSNNALVLSIIRLYMIHTYFLIFTILALKMCDKLEVRAEIFSSFYIFSSSLQYTLPQLLHKDFIVVN